MNGEKYVELLKEKLAILMCIHKCTIFMHDGALCHSSKELKNFLMTAKVTKLEYLGNSSDLKPVENSEENGCRYAALKRKVAYAALKRLCLRWGSK